VSKDSSDLAEKRGPHRFKKGTPKPPGSGRKRGQQNRITIALRDAVVEAAEILGDKRWSKDTKHYSVAGPGGVLGYMLFLGRFHEPIFGQLLKQVLPHHVVGSMMHRQYRTEEEVREMCAEYGIPFESMIDIGVPEREARRLGLTVPGSDVKQDRTP
jgi:hypothetical protein